jgi:hypothetical protein
MEDIDRADLGREQLFVLFNEYEEGPAIQISELQVLQAVARLEEYSFLNLRRTDDGERHYGMHKLAQEAMRYNLKIRSSIKTLV